ncbi:MAG: hypothetical protein ACOX8O_00225 [Christensenellales bacterium]
MDLLPAVKELRQAIFAENIDVIVVDNPIPSAISVAVKNLMNTPILSKSLLAKAT